MLFPSQFYQPGVLPYCPAVMFVDFKLCFILQGGLLATELAPSQKGLQNCSLLNYLSEHMMMIQSKHKLTKLCVHSYISIGSSYAQVFVKVQVQ